MIIYFSATGNCKNVAEKIATATNDKAVSMTETAQITLKDGENLGIVTPTYFWSLPVFVDEFLNKVKIQNAENKYVYCVATYGTTCGQVDYFVKEHLKNKGISLSASFGVKTVDNYTVLFDVSDKEKVKKTLEREEKQLNEILPKIKNREKVFVKKDKMPLYFCKKAKFFYNGARKTKHLNVTTDCVNCGLCESECPVGAIKIVDTKPTWIKKKCTMCFKCLHNCPTFAIQYDNKTQKKGQYIHP